MPERGAGGRTREAAGPRTAEDEALRELARRPLTRAEIRERLGRKGIPEGEIEAALARLGAARLVDDRALAEHYLRIRAERGRLGKERLLRDLERRGIDRETAEASWSRLEEAGDVDAGAALFREVERRVGTAGGTLDRRRYARVYNALLRAGFEPEAVEAALERYRSGLEGPNLAERNSDDLA